MNEQTLNKVLWILFGFALISAIDSIIRFLTMGIFIGNLALGISYEFMKFSVPSATIILYCLAAIFLLKRAKKTRENISPIIFFVTVGIVFLARFGTSSIYRFLSPSDFGYPDSSSSGFLDVYGFVAMMNNLSIWISVIVVAIVCYRKKTLNRK